MADDRQYNIADLLKFAHEEKPNDFKTAFDGVMHDKISAAIDARRQEVADRIMNGADEDIEVDVDDETEEFEDDSDNVDEEEE